MGVGHSKVEPEILQFKRNILKSYASFPLSNPEQSFWEKAVKFDQVNPPGTNNMMSPAPSGNKEQSDNKSNGNISGNDNGSSNKLPYNKDRICNYPTNNPPRRRLIHPPTVIIFRDNHCCKVPCRKYTPTPLEPDESNVPDAGAVTLQDSIGTIVLPPFRHWQIFPGNNRFYCDGRIITGPDRLVFYLSFGLLNLVFALFAGVVLPLEGSKDACAAYGVGAATGLLYFYCVSTMLCAALTDPGIVPRASQAEVESTMKQNFSFRNPIGVQPFIRERVNGKDTIRRWCHTCLFYKPPRATHCRACDNCVDRFDHHCPFLGNCVGQRNYHFFLAFLIAIVVSGCFIILNCIWVLYTNFMASKDHVHTISRGEIICTILTATLAISSIIPVMVLLFMHIGLVTSELTTNEDLKRSYGAQNPYDRGSKRKNCIGILCSPKVPSLISRRDFVTREWLNSLEQFESVNITLLKRFGRPPNYDEPNSPRIQIRPNNAELPGELKDASNKNKSFVFMHQKSEPDIIKKLRENTAAGDRAFDDHSEGSMRRFKFSDENANEISKRSRTAAMTLEEELHNLRHTSDRHLASLLVRKEQGLRNAFSEYDLGTGRSRDLGGWKNSQRTSYQRYTP